MSFAAVQKHVAVLERAGLLTKRRSGREQLASGDVEAVRSVASMLDELEAIWRGRISRIDDLLTQQEKQKTPGSFDLSWTSGAGSCGSVGYLALSE